MLPLRVSTTTHFDYNQELKIPIMEVNEKLVVLYWRE
jgi:hypothetical protein